MKKQLINGNFSSIPLAALIASTLDVDSENEVRDDDSRVLSRTDGEDQQQPQ